jgi:hypothetical protein
MNTRLASAFGLAMLAVAFSFSTSFACSETSHTTASVVESAVSESGVNITRSADSAEANVPEGQVGEVAAPASIVSNIEAPPTEASASPVMAFGDTIPVESTETVMGVVPDQNSEDDEGAAIPACGIAGIEPSVTEEPSQTAAPESEAKAPPELSAQTDTAEGRIEVAEPAAAVAAVKPPSTDVNAPRAVVFVDAVPVEITETVTVVVPVQTSEDDGGAAIPASGIGIEPSVTEASSQTSVPEGEAKATELSEQAGTAEGQIEVAEPAAVVAAVEPPSTDVNAPPAIVSVDAVLVEITETVTVVVPGQKSQDIDDVEITGAEPEHPTAAPNLKHDAATAALDGGEAAIGRQN